MNSQLFQFCYHSKFKNETDLFPKIRIAQVNHLPIRKADNQKQFEEIVDEIINIKRKDYDADISTLEKRLNKMVYELYEIKDEEIMRIENGLISKLNNS